MKWIKHHCDAHRGNSIQTLMDKFGHTGLCYWILVEMCGEKLEQYEGEVKPEHCNFSFHYRILRQNLRIGAVKLRSLLDQCQTMALLSYEIKDNLILISMPKLAEILDRDQKRPREIRAISAPRLDKEEDKEKEKNIYEEVDADFESAFKVFKTLGVQKGPQALKRYREQMKDADDRKNFHQSIIHYIEFLTWPENSWRRPKQTFEAFLGTKASGFFWHDFIELPPRQAGPQPTGQSSNSLEYWIAESKHYIYAAQTIARSSSDADAIAVALKHYLGDERYEIYRRIGGQRIRDTKANEEFKLAKEIKFISEQLYQKAGA